MTLRDDGLIDYDFYRAKARELRTATLNRSMRTAWQLCRAALTARKGPAMRRSKRHRWCSGVSRSQLSW
jgi:hypothetical protein